MHAISLNDFDDGNCQGVDEKCQGVDDKCQGVDDNCQNIDDIVKWFWSQRFLKMEFEQIRDISSLTSQSFQVLVESVMFCWIKQINDHEDVI